MDLHDCFAHREYKIMNGVSVGALLGCGVQGSANPIFSDLINLENGKRSVCHYYYNYYKLEKCKVKFGESASYR